jgi:hypothetical protein
MIMLPDELQADLRKKIAEAEHPREMAVDVMVALQNDYGYLSDEAVEEGAVLLGMTPLEMEELATFYAVRPPCVRRHRLLDEWLWGNPRLLMQETGHPDGRDDPGWDVYSPAHRLPGVLRSFSGHAGEPQALRPAHPGKGGFHPGGAAETAASAGGADQVGRETTKIFVGHR